VTPINGHIIVRNAYKPEIFIPIDWEAGGFEARPGAPPRGPAIAKDPPAIMI
jgi:hypothetical protein